MTAALPRFEDASASASPEAGFGALDSSRGPLPLKAMDVKSRITGLLFELDVVQTFVNTHTEPIEAVYIFPLPPRAAVNGFSMKVGDHLVEGKLMERGQAREKYQQAIRSGKRASMAEEERPNIFTLSVGNLMPGDVAEVSFSLAGLLTLNGDQAEWRFPLVVAPRYIPGITIEVEPAGLGIDLDTDQVPDASRLNPPVLLQGFPNPVQLGIEVQLDPCGLEFQGLSSSLHAIDIESSGKLRRVRLAHEERLNRDFVLRFRISSQTLRTSAVLVPDPSGKDEKEDTTNATLMVTVVPPQAGTELKPPKDVVFLLDQSGSMKGWKIRAARRAMTRMIDTLGPEDRFGIIAFDYATVTLGIEEEGLLPATDLHRFKAAAFLSEIEAEGGTEMLAPVQMATKALHQQGESTRERIILLVTDGQVGNEPAMVTELRKRPMGCRFQILGIGESANESIFQRMASATEGWFLTAESEERLDLMLLEAARLFGQPLVRNLSISAPGLLESNIVSSGSFDLYPGTPLILLARVATQSDGLPVKLHGQSALGEDFSNHFKACSNQAASVRNVWARWKIRDMEDADADHEDIVGVSLAHGVLSRFTAYLAVDERGPVNPEGTPATILQPVEDEEDSCNVAAMIRGSSSCAVFNEEDVTFDCLGFDGPDENVSNPIRASIQPKILKPSIPIPSVRWNPTPRRTGEDYRSAINDIQKGRRAAVKLFNDETDIFALDDLRFELTGLVTWLKNKGLDTIPEFSAFILFVESTCASHGNDLDLKQWSREAESILQSLLADLTAHFQFPAAWVPERTFWQE